ALVLGKMLVAAPATIDRVTQGLRLVLETGVGCVVDIQPRHLVETHHAIDRTCCEITLDPGGEALIAGVIEDSLDGCNQHLEAIRHLALPDHRVDPDAVTATLALLGDTHEVAL